MGDGQTYLADGLIERLENKLLDGLIYPDQLKNDFIVLDLQTQHGNRVC